MMQEDFPVCEWKRDTLIKYRRQTSMHLEGDILRRACKFLVTKVAAESTFSHVNDHATFKVEWNCKLLAANFTYEGLFPCMKAHVFF